jgi:hypothetical protein
MSTVLRLLTAACVIAMLGIASKASATSTTFTSWLCEIDLAAAGAPVPSGSKPSIFTTNSQKLCTGSAPNENINIDCTGQVPGWTFGNQTYHDFPCQIFKGQCGEPAFIQATTTTLTISSTGVANLKCNLN